jgi:hypothetical protein
VQGNDAVAFGLDSPRLVENAPPAFGYAYPGRNGFAFIDVLRGGNPCLQAGEEPRRSILDTQEISFYT